MLGPEYVNLAADTREVNGGKFGKIPDQNTWKLSKDAALVYFCDNETVRCRVPRIPYHPCTQR